MSVWTGQASVRTLGAVLSWVARILLVLLGVALVGGGALAVRLARGPMEVTRLVRLVAGPRLTLSHASAFWNRRADQAPLVLTLTTPVLHRADGSVVAGFAEASLGVLPGRLLLGRVRPVFVTARAGSVALMRAANGSFGLDTGRPAAHTAASPDKTWRRLRRVSVQKVDITLTDRARSAAWQGRVNALEFFDLDGGRFSGRADVSLRLGGQTGTAIATLAPAPGGGTQVAGTIGALDPAPLAGLFGATIPFDGPVGASFEVTLDPAWQPRAGTAHLQLGAGRIRVGGAVDITGGVAVLAADAARRRARLTGLRLGLEGGPVLTGGGELAWAGRRANATVAIDIDRLEFSGLGRIWPEQLAHDARAWVTGNATAGTARGIHVSLGLAIADGGVTLTAAGGQLRADDLSLAWLRPVPPLVHGSAVLTLQSPDALTVAISRAEQTPSDRASPPLVLTNATLRVTGLAAPRQVGTIDGYLAGPVAQTIALLREPRLHLLAAHKMDFGTPSGTVRAHMHLEVPLDDRATIDDIPIRADARLDNLHLGGIVAGKDLDAGAFTLTATNDGLRFSGTAQLAGAPSRLTVTQDFRAGPPGQVVSTYHAAGAATVAQLRAAGLPAGGLADGSVGYDAALTEHRSGAGEAIVHVDLRRAALDFPALGWAKAADTDSTADAEVRLDHDRLVGVDRLTVAGPGVSVQGRAVYAAGKPVSLNFDRIVLGQTSAAGELRFAAAPDQPVQADLHGTVLDLSARMKPDAARRTPGRAEAQAAARQRKNRAGQTAPTRGQPWTASLRFDRVVLGPARVLSGVSARADDDGWLVRHAQIAGTAGRGKFRLALAPAGTGRALNATAEDAAGLLGALGVLADVQGGTLAVDAAYDDRQADHPLAGTATIDRFRVVGAPPVARLLQAMTLYGVMDVLRGPGLGITRLVAPFRFANEVLTLDGARAYSGSLGFTAKGDIDLAAARADLTGTIVPAYFFNTLLGKVPLVGKLFSPEKGGGVFAAAYTLSGPLGSPKVAINPLAALTPGFLRGVFGAGKTPAPDQPAK